MVYTIEKTTERNLAMYNFLLFILIIFIGFFISKNNYKNRATTINSNLLEYADEIIKIYNNLTEANQNSFKNSLKQREAYVFNNLIDNFYHDTNNINVLQNSLFIMEDIMKKLKIINTNNKI